MGSFFSTPAGTETAAVPPTRAPEPPRKKRRLSHPKSHAQTPPPTRAMLQQPPSETVETPSEAPMTAPKTFRKIKVALFCAFLGDKYSGMQINPGVVTIEQLLIRALYLAGFISEQNKGSLSKVHWMRAARTDKGVSAACQCVSVKLLMKPEDINNPEAIDRLNQHLPDDVVAFRFLKVTGGFNARADCHKRRYEYLFPVRLLGGPNAVMEEETPGKGDPRCAKLAGILKAYQGTHCFANFTDGLDSTNPSSNRYMLNLSVSQPFLPPQSGVYYITVEVLGQSFLLHQIRKMVGMAVAVYLGVAPLETISVALCPDVKLPTPMAPASGLLLDTLFFDSYCRRTKDCLPTPISCHVFQKEKDEFKQQRIYRNIAEKERHNRTLEMWFRDIHKFKMHYKPELIAEQHDKYVTSNVGKEEKRKLKIASMYPIVTDIEQFLGSPDPELLPFTEKLREQFQQEYDAAPTFLARAPGRVILIGEHLDYNGLPVIGTALSQGSFIAGCLDETEDTIEVRHMESDKYAPAKLRHDGIRMSLLEPEGLNSDWAHYVSWGVKAIFNNLPRKRTVSGGGRLLVAGNLPQAGGLASGSALVTAAALCTSRLNRQRMPKVDVALHAAQGESLGAGTHGGAVDHILSMCSEKGSALEIKFGKKPALKKLSLPSGAKWYAVGSDVKARKGFDNTVKNEFNLRAAECRVGAALLARRLDVYLEKSVSTPGQLLFQAGKTGALQCKSMATLTGLASRKMSDDEVLSREEVQEQLQVGERELESRFLRGVKSDSFKVGKRMRHVFDETLRVEEFVDVLSSDKMSDEEQVQALGRILNEGQRSLRENFESSLAGVEDLVEFCRENGAIGSRMTGAGWGGFIVNIVKDEDEGRFVEQVVRRVGKHKVIQVTASTGAGIFAVHTKYGQGNGNHDDERKRKRG